MGIAQIRKALTAGGTAFVAALSAGLLKGGIKKEDVALAIGSFIVVGFLTFLVPNAPPKPAA